METLEQVNQESRERLYPSLTNPSWLILRKRREIFRRWFADLDKQNLSVLDIGGRIQPYRSQLKDRLHSYIAIDVTKTPLVSIVARGEEIPLESSQFDLVICSQVLEYIFDPAAVIAEVHRVLKPSGYFILSVPSVWPRDADEEYWRFLPAGLRRLLSAFGDVEVVAEGSSITGFFRTTNACIDIFVRYPALRWLFRRALCPLINLSGALLESIAGSDNDQFAANFSVRARR